MLAVRLKDVQPLGTTRPRNYDEQQSIGHQSDQLLDQSLGLGTTWITAWPNDFRLPGTDRALNVGLLKRTSQVQTAALSHQRCHQQMSLRDPEDATSLRLGLADIRNVFQSVGALGYAMAR